MTTSHLKIIKKKLELQQANLICSKKYYNSYFATTYFFQEEKIKHNSGNFHDAILLIPADI